MPRGWFRVSFTISNDKRYDLIISVHHNSYHDSVLAVGSVLEFSENVIVEGVEQEVENTIPIKFKPHTVSLVHESPRLKQNLEHYIRDIVKIGLTIIANEIV